MHLDNFFFSSRRRHTRLQGDWSSDVCSSDLDAGPSGRMGGWIVRRVVVEHEAQPLTHLEPDAALQRENSTALNGTALDGTAGGGRRGSADKAAPTAPGFDRGSLHIDYRGAHDWHILIKAVDVLSSTAQDAMAGGKRRPPRRRIIPRAITGSTVAA